MANKSFNTAINQFPLNKEGIIEIKNHCKYGEDWPVVYILSNSREAYVGETQNAYERMTQHIKTKEKKKLTTIHLMSSNSFNKSAILDIENMLITHMHADGRFILQNANGGQSRLHNYYQRSEYQNTFAEIWEKLLDKKLVTHSLFEVENNDIFKFSPYKELTSEQYHVVEEMLQIYSSAIQQENQTTVVINGGAGTGKSLIAIYFLNFISNILGNNFDITDVGETIDDESLLNRTNLIKSIKTFGTRKIAFVIPVPSFRKTVRKVFHTIKELRGVKVVSPSEAAKGDYDVLVVDEAHRLKRRVKLTNYGTHDKVNHELQLSCESTELDWLKFTAKKLLILFYDGGQSVKESDVLKEDFDVITNNPQTKKFYLSSQLRVKGGNEYISFVHDIFNKNPNPYILQDGYDLKVFDSCHEMFLAVKEKNVQYKGLCRMLSGLSFYWRRKVRDKKSTFHQQDFDFEIEGYHYSWNDGFNATDFITDDSSIDEIGCIYTCQGHDLNIAGVIFGKDISYNPLTKTIEYHPENFIDTNSKSSDQNKTIQNIINAYLVLLTRGVYGTYIYAVDENLRNYLKSLIKTDGKID
ncbi:MAG: DNA/RNA helicase domain-containing protein [Bacilli bacterium]